MKEVDMAMLVDGVAKVISGAPFPSKQSLTKARKAVEFVLAAPALDLPTLAERDQLRADKMAMFEDAKRWAEEAGRLAAELSDARLEIAGLRRDVERLDSGRIILSHRADEWGNERTEFCGVDLRKAIDAATADKSKAPELFVCTGDQIRCHDGNGCECEMRGLMNKAEGP